MALLAFPVESSMWRRLRREVWESMASCGKGMPASRSSTILGWQSESKETAGAPEGGEGEEPSRTADRPLGGGGTWVCSPAAPPGASEGQRPRAGGDTAQCSPSRWSVAARTGPSFAVIMGIFRLSAPVFAVLS